MNDRTGLRLALSDGRTVGYAEWGDPTGVPVIYCHGFPGSRLEARLADRHARELGIRLIAPDRPGFGLSSLAPGRRLGDWPHDLVELADHLGVVRFRVIGVSGGAPYAIACGQQLCERIDGIALVCGLGALRDDKATVGMNAAAAAALNFQRAFPRLGYQAYLRIIGPLLQRYPAGIFKILVGNGTVADREVLAEAGVRSAIVQSFAEAFRHGAAGPAQELALIIRDWGIDPAGVAQPVQLWHGEADRTVPVAMGRRYAALLPNCSARFIAGEGHFSLVVRYLRQILASLVDPLGPDQQAPG